MKKLRFLLVLPVAALAWVGAATFGPAPALAAGSAGPISKSATAQGRIGTITWQGNTFLSTTQLNQALGLKPGDAYDKQTLDNKLAYRPDNSDITSLYMDQGYLFFQLDPVATTQPDGSTNLTFRISEGRQARIGTIAVAGNRKVATADVLAMLPLHQGDLFSRSKLLQAQKRLAESGKFDPTKININPQPIPQPTAATDLVNIGFALTEK